MAGNIDKTRPEQLGERAFVGTGVSTIPDILEEQKDLRQMMQDMINEAMSNVVGATVIQDVPDQIEYNFIGGGVTYNEMYEAIDQRTEEMWNTIQYLLNTIQRMDFERRLVDDYLQQQINDLQSGGGQALACTALLGSHQENLSRLASTVIELDTAWPDPHGMFDATAHKITIPINGLYWVSGIINWNCTETGKWYYLRLDKNGSGPHLRDVIVPDVTGSYWSHDGRLLPLTAGDYLQLSAWPLTTADTADVLNTGTRLSVFLVEKT